MEQRQLGKSDRQVSVVALGTFAFSGWYWGPADDSASEATVRAALDAGMTSIDTAPVYGCGRAEEVLGRALKGRRHEAQLLTKCGLRWDDDEGTFDFDMRFPDGSEKRITRNLRPTSVRFECEQSLKLLDTDYLHLFQCHWPDPETPIADTMGEMVRLHTEGKIRAVGVSNFSVEQMEEARQALGNIPLASDQPKYNLLQRKIEADVLPYCREHQVGVLAYSPLELGLLSGKFKEAPTTKGDLRKTRGWFKDEKRGAINEAVRTHLGRIAEEQNATPAQVAVAWVIRTPGVTSALMGARTPEQAVENAGAARVVLSSKQMLDLAEAFASVA